MGSINVSTINIGGTQKASAELTTGAVNIIRGTSSSGKSSLMRGIHLGLVGGPDKHRDEIERLHLNDTKSDEALLLRGAAEGSSIIEFEGGRMEATIPRSGYVSGKGSNEKAVYTSMLSSLPATSLHTAVFNASTDNPNDFRWVSEVVSEAKDFLIWQNVLNPLEQEIISIRARFEQWKLVKGDSEARKEEINIALELVNKEERKLSATQGAKEARIGKALGTARTQYSRHAEEYNRLSTEVQRLKAQNEQQLRRISASDAQRYVAERRLNEANDLMEMELIDPDVVKLDSTIEKAQRDVESAKGEANPDVILIVDAYLQVKDSTPQELAKAIEIAQSNLGDKSKLSLALESLKIAKATKDGEIRKFMEARSKIGSAAQMAAAARSEIKAAKQTIDDAKKNMSTEVGQLPKMEDDLAKSERQFKSSQKEVKALVSEAGSGDSPGMRKLLEQRKSLESEKESLESSTTFELRFTSLQMMPNEAIRITEELGNQILGDGSSGDIRKELIQSNLTGISVPDVRSLIKAEIDNGILADIGSTSKWVSTTVENQLQQTRRIFNNVGTTLFGTLASSPISGVELDTDYELRITWKDGSVTGLTGAEGERTILAAALLIAMRKAFTPDIPILMFDGMLANLDPASRKSFLDFLKSYSETEDIAVLVSLFDENISEAEVSLL